MKLRAFLVGLGYVTALGVVVADTESSQKVRINLDTPAQSTPQSSGPAKSAAKTKGATTVTATTSTTIGKAAPPPKTGKPEKKPEELKMDGLVVSRGERGYLGIKVDNNKWKISFYDREKKPVSADVASIALRWPVQYQPNPERALLSPADGGKVMTSEKTVRPPFTFTLYATLLKDAATTDQPAESYVVEFHQ